MAQARLISYNNEASANHAAHYLSAKYDKPFAVRQICTRYYVVVRVSRRRRKIERKEHMPESGGRRTGIIKSIQIEVYRP
jgi:hypothetical protein